MEPSRTCNYTSQEICPYVQSTQPNSKELNLSNVAHDYQELVLIAFSYLKPSDIANLAQTCKSINVITDNEELWKQLASRQWNALQATCNSIFFRYQVKPFPCNQREVNWKEFSKENFSLLTEKEIEQFKGPHHVTIITNFSERGKSAVRTKIDITALNFTKLFAYTNKLPKHLINQLDMICGISFRLKDVIDQKDLSRMLINARFIKCVLK